MLPSDRQSAPLTIPQETYGVMQIMVEPNHSSPAMLSIADVVIAIGQTPDEIIRQFGQATGRPSPKIDPVNLEKGEGLFYLPQSQKPLVRFRSLPPTGRRRRHHRKYAEGEMPPENSFYFRGPQEKLNLGAQNLIVFRQLAEGVDDGTWLHHLKRGNYSDWFRQVFHDEELAEETARIEQQNLPAQDSRRRVPNAIERRYTAPA